MLQQQQQTRTNSRGEPYVIGPTGVPLTIADLPPVDTGRWVIRRKAEVVAAVRGGLLTLDEACERYSLPTRNSSPGRSPSTATDWRACAPRVCNSIAELNSPQIDVRDAAAPGNQGGRTRFGRRGAAPPKRGAG